MPRKQVFLLFLILLVAMLSVAFFLILKPFFFATSIPPGKTYELVLNENGFSPSEIEIKPGDSVKFSTTLKQPFWPASDLHPTHGIFPEFDPQQPVDPTQSWTFQFLKSGAWKYHDHLNPMHRGIISVKP